jgi:hypothetical protein
MSRKLLSLKQLASQKFASTKQVVIIEEPVVDTTVPVDGHPAAVVPIDDASVTSAEWEQQVRENEEAEEWDKSFGKIPCELQSQYEPMLGGMVAGKRIQVYVMIDKLNWELKDCSDLHVALKCCGLKLQDSLIDVLWEIEQVPALKHALVLLPRCVLLPKIVIIYNHFVHLRFV